MTEIRPDHFKFSTAILSRLGEELNPHPDQGIIELVRNAYDADALTCRVKLKKVNKKGGMIRITDDGYGMDFEEISNGWLVLGRSTKQRRRRTKLGRLPVGDKGLGRLAALRMGTRATLITRPKKEPLFEHRVTIDWGKYDNVNVVEDVNLDIETTAATKSGEYGTEVIIEQLKTALKKTDIKRLARSLLLLSDPFGSPSGFRPILDTPEYEQLETIVRHDFFSINEYHLIAKIDSKGMGQAKARDSNGKLLWTAKHKDLRKNDNPYETPKASFEFWAFNLGKKEFLPRSVSMGDLRTWLRAVGGVHFYHRSLRVHPYGDKGHDWLDMNLRRSQSPELRPSTNTSIGRVSVDDPDNLLIQKTDRTGFIENTPFDELRSFAQEALEWLANRRMKKREDERIKKRTTAIRTFKKTRKALEQAITKLPSRQRDQIKQIVDSFENARTKQVETLKEEVQLYRTLSTVGTTFAVFAHELKNPLSRIQNMARAIEDKGQTILKDKYAKFLQRPVKIITNSTNALIALPRIAIQLLERDKRQTKLVYINMEVEAVLNMVEPFLKEVKVKPEVDLVDTNPPVYGSKASIQCVLMNIITNAVNAFVLHREYLKARKIVIRTSVAKDNVHINVLDNGPGIENLSTEEIWLPGKTTTPNGTGLGLTIVRDTVTDLGGRAYAIAHSELGGAEFFIELPIAEEKI